MITNYRNCCRFTLVLIKHLCITVMSDWCPFDRVCACTVQTLLHYSYLIGVHLTGFTLVLFKHLCITVIWLVSIWQGLRLYCSNTSTLQLCLIGVHLTGFTLVLFKHLCITVIWLVSIWQGLRLYCSNTSTLQLCLIGVHLTGFTLVLFKHLYITVMSDWCPFDRVYACTVQTLLHYSYIWLVSISQGLRLSCSNTSTLQLCLFGVHLTALSYPSRSVFSLPHRSRTLLRARRTHV